jgi:hypothetical protein
VLVMLLATLVSGAVGCGSGGGDRPQADAAAPPDAAADAGAGRDAPGYGDAGRDAGQATDAGGPGGPDGGPAADGAPGPDRPPPDAPPDTGSGGGDARDGAAADATPAPGAYSAAVIHGGYDRLVIVKFDQARRLCIRITLVGNDSASVLPLHLPDTWQVESAGATAATDACAAGAQPAPAVVAATSGSGSVSWSGLVPCSVDVDVTLVFGAPGLPTQEILRVGALLPSGC